jgi:hypothetical protein
MRLRYKDSLYTEFCKLVDECRKTYLCEAVVINEQEYNFIIDVLAERKDSDRLLFLNIPRTSDIWRTFDGVRIIVEFNT